MKRNKTIIIIVACVILLVVLVTWSVNRTQETIPSAALMDVESFAFIKLRSEDIGNFLPNYNNEASLVIGEAKLTNKTVERRAYITFSGLEPIYLGALTKQLANVPVETLFFEVNGSRFVALWVDESVQGTLQSVTFGRPIVQYSDDTMNTLRVSAVANRVAIVPFFADEAHLWDYVTEIRIQSAEEGFVWQKKFDEPIYMSDLSQAFTIPVSD